MRWTTLTLAALAASCVAYAALAAPTAIPYVGYLVYDSGGPVHGAVNLQVEVRNAE